MKNPTPLQYIPFTTLEQKKSPLLKEPGALSVALNVEAEKVGELNPRRGYYDLDLRNALHSGGESLRRLSSCATLRNELVVFGFRRLLALTSKTGAVSDASFVDRGSSNRGALSVQYVAASRTSRADPSNVFSAYPWE